MTDEVWTNAEIVRAVIALTQAVKDLTERIESLGTEYVRKEVYDIRHDELVRRVDLIGEEQVNLSADVTRHHREHSEAQRGTFIAFIPPIVTGVLVAVVVFALAHIK